ncbi:MAG: VCBS repeat-containing protein [Myxococcota bacterium]|nr:VCBS repeat-containing protein [Myxococcota bacterium]
MTRAGQSLIRIGALIGFLSGSAGAEPPSLSPPPVPPSPQSATQSLTQLPAAERCFAVDLDGDGHDELLGAQRDQLWALRLDGEGSGALLWRQEGPGHAQQLVAGDRGEGRRLFVAWGVGRGLLQAPLTLTGHQPKSGEKSEVLGEWRGTRRQAAALALVDRGSASELVLARYRDKYMVELLPYASGDPQVPRKATLVRRMLSSLAWGDLDGDGKLDRFEGRVYGNQRGEYGDLWVSWGAGGRLRVPVDRGVRALIFRKEANGATLYFADGWVARYGKEASAQLSRLRMINGRPQVERLAEISNDFTLFSLHSLPLKQAEGFAPLIARGSKAIYRFHPTTAGPWRTEVLAQLEPGLDVGVGRDVKGPFLAIPHASSVLIQRWQE